MYECSGWIWGRDASIWVQTRTPSFRRHVWRLNGMQIFPFLRPIFPRIAFAKCDQQVQQSKKKRLASRLKEFHHSRHCLSFQEWFPHTRSLMHTHILTHRRYSVSFCSTDVDHLITKALAVPPLYYVETYQRSFPSVQSDIMGQKHYN